MSSRAAMSVAFLVGGVLGALAGAAVVGFLLTPAPEQVTAASPAAPADASRVTACPRATEQTPPWLVDPAPGTSAAAAPIPIPQALLERVGFWRQIWGEHPEHVYLLIDRRRPWTVHQQVDCRDLFAHAADLERAERLCDRKVIGARNAERARLLRQRRRPQREVLKRYAGNGYLARTGHRNLYIVEGRRDGLRRATERGAPYWAAIEQIFQAHGVPPELSRVAVVESLFATAARSHAGAAGPYQFVAATARAYGLNVDAAVDERLDPLRSAWAAAAYLRDLYQQAGRWPLALTAYNTGPTRLRRLLKQRRTDKLARLTDFGDVEAFGFDGQNYFAQVAAVVELTRDLPPGQGAGPLRYLRLERPVTLDQAAGCLEVDATTLTRLNPALLKPVRQGTATVPPAYTLALPLPSRNSP